MRPPEAPLILGDLRPRKLPYLCPEIGDLRPQGGRRLSGFRGFEAPGPEIFGISRASKAKFGTADNCL